VKPSRRTQPHRKGPARVMEPGGSLAAMLRGATAQGRNPMDVKRAAQKGYGKGLARRLAAARRR
jgi:hypothetical protein